MTLTVGYPMALFRPVCPIPSCGVANHVKATHCGACGAALYPSPKSLRHAKKR